MLPPSMRIVDGALQRPDDVRQLTIPLPYLAPTITPARLRPVTIPTHRARSSISSGMPLSLAFRIWLRTVADSRILLLGSSAAVSASRGTTNKRLRRVGFICFTSSWVGLGRSSRISLGFERLVTVNGLSLHSRTGGATGAQEPDSDGGLRNSLFLRDFLGRIPLHLKFEERPIARAAELQDAGQVDRRQIHFRPGVIVRQRLVTPLASEDTAVNVHRD